MNFYYPQFLIGLLAVAIPVIIHLFNFQKPKTAVFTNVKFLKNVKEITSNKLKIKHLLVLLSRIAFIIFLVLAFSQPFLNGTGSANTNGKPEIFFYLDNSYSMQTEVQESNAFDASLKSIADIKNIYSPNTNFNITTNDFEGKDQFFINKERLEERLTEITYSAISREGQAIVRKISNITGNRYEKIKHVFLFSDFQKSTFGDLNKIKFDTSSQYHLVPVQGEIPSNIFVDSAWLSNPMIRVKENNTVEARLINESDEPVKNLLLKLYIDNVQSSIANVDILPRSNQKVKFNINVNTSGQKKCKIVFEDFPVTFDNEYYFVINVSPKLNILHLYDKRSNYIPLVFGNSKIFNLHSQSVSDFDYSLVSVSNLIVLDELREIPEALKNPLKDFISKGGSLLIYPSEKNDPNSYSQFFKKIYVPVPVNIPTDTTSLKVNYTLANPNIGNPYFKDVFEKNNKNVEMPYAIPVLDLQKKGEKLLSYKNGDSYISINTFGNGKIFVAASPLNAKYSNFPRHATFVPTMYKVAFQSLPGDLNLAYNFQNPAIHINVDVEKEQSIFYLAGENFKIIPYQKLNGRELTFSLPDQNFKPGYYNLLLGDSVVSTLAFNYNNKESLLKTYSKTELQQSINQKNVRVYESEIEKFSKNFKENTMGFPLWKYCLLLSLLFLLIEILLIRFY